MLTHAGEWVNGWIDVDLVCGILQVIIDDVSTLFCSALLIDLGAQGKALLDSQHAHVLDRVVEGEGSTVYLRHLMYTTYVTFARTSSKAMIVQYFASKWRGLVLGESDVLILHHTGQVSEVSTIFQDKLFTKSHSGAVIDSILSHRKEHFSTETWTMIQ